jgi:hypothetical protein
MSPVAALPRRMREAMEKAMVRARLTKSARVSGWYASMALIAISRARREPMGPILNSGTRWLATVNIRPIFGSIEGTAWLGAVGLDMDGAALVGIG